ncbi:carboxymuconolactone decarboxylase family protein [Bdellovibrio bacteriovorus]|uniref:carboxymuconolactone decarboxylase family protein n=1 Tax=Bdellovibrio bacteriovorus TaxID=959 RepID=UPI0035A6E45B
MKAKWVFLILSLVVGVSAAQNKSAPAKPNMKSEYTATLKEIKSVFGAVPTFMKEFPPEALPGAWQEFRDVQLSPGTELDPKTKELIGLAVSSQIPCRYCIYFHKKAATFNGAKPEEIKMAIAVAASTRKWSTHLYGAQLDLMKFKNDIDKIIVMAKNKTDKVPEPVVVTNAETAMADMENTLGFVPEFMKAYSQEGLPGAWKAFKGMDMNPQTVLTPKTKDLISLAVSSQIPCQYCIYADTEFAKADGATPNEISEAITMAGIVRHWSTVLNGLRQDEKAFEREIDQAFRYLERSKRVSPKKISAQ